MRRVVLAVLLGVLWFPTSATAKCVWEWDCSTGKCRQVPICDNSLDLPPIRPLEIPPIPPPSIKPIQPPTLPPIGTRTCRQANLCDAYGKCRWQTVCE